MLTYLDKKKLSTWYFKSWNFHVIITSAAGNISLISFRVTPKTFTTIKQKTLRYHFKVHVKSANTYQTLLFNKMSIVYQNVLSFVTSSIK